MPMKPFSRSEISDKLLNTGLINSIMGIGILFFLYVYMVVWLLYSVTTEYLHQLSAPFGHSPCLGYWSVDVLCQYKTHIALLIAISLLVFFLKACP